MKRYLLLAALLLIQSLNGCSSKTPAKPEEAPPIPDQAVEKFSVTETEEGKPHWVLEALSAQITESEKKAVLDLPTIKFYQNGQYVSSLVAAKGRINMENYDITGDGKCTLTTAKGEVLDTSNLHYSSKSKLITTADNVKLTRQNEVVYGKGMEATPDLESIKIRNQRTEIRK